MFQTYIVDENTRTSIHEDYPDGTWFGVFWIEDTDEWENIKNGTFKGFSVEINVIEIPADEITEDYFKKEKDDSLDVIVRGLLSADLPDDILIKALKEVSKK